MSPRLAAKPIGPDVLDVLRLAKCEGNHLYLPPTLLPAPLYRRVNQVIEAIGGKWKRGGRAAGSAVPAGAHVFEHAAAPLLDEVLQTGMMPPPNPLAYFPTPPEVVGRMLELAEVDATIHNILEPSAGAAAIARAIPGEPVVTCVEMHAGRAGELRLGGFDVVEADFLECSPDAIGAPGKAGTALGVYDRILMNPPFTSESDSCAWIAHIEHALRFLASDGRLISVVPQISEGTHGFSRIGRSLKDRDWRVEPLPENAFKSAGTAVRAALLIVEEVPTCA